MAGRSGPPPIMANQMKPGKAGKTPEIYNETPADFTSKVSSGHYGPPTGAKKAGAAKTRKPAVKQYPKEKSPDGD